MSKIKLPKLKYEEVEEKPKQFINQTMPILISPAEIYFRKIQKDHCYEIPVIVKNLTKKARRIRVFQPKSQKFRCDYDIKGPIAAGLSVKLQVSFSTSYLGDFFDEIKIISEDNFSQIIKISAISSQAQILFEPFINLGFIKTGTQKCENILFQNEGDAEGYVELKLDSEQKDIMIEPQEFIIEANKTFQVKITFLSNQAGIVKTKIDVDVQGFYDFQKQIDINATVVDYNRFFIDSNGKQIESLNFNKMLFGSQHKQSGFLVNNTPVRVQYKQKIRMGSSKQIREAKNLNSLQTPIELGIEQAMKVASCFPSDGYINSYSQIPLTFICEPRITEQILTTTMINAMHTDNKKKFIEEDYEYCSIIEIDNDEPILVGISGKGVMPDIKLSQSFFHFGECPVNENRDIKFSIQNNNHLPLDVNFAKHCYFSIDPINFTIIQEKFQEFIISFNPKSAGTFQGDIELQFFQHYKIPLKCIGISNTFQQKKFKKKGIESVQEDYSKNLNLVEKDRYEVYHRKKGLSYQHASLTNPSQTLNFSKTLAMHQSANNVEEFNQYFKNQQNKNKYDNFLKNSRQVRMRSDQQSLIKTKIQEITNKSLAQKKKTPIDYDQLDIKLDKVIQSPKLKQNAHFEQLYVNKKVGNHQPKIQYKMVPFKPDPQKKQKKKFPLQPKSQIEARDCAADLSGEDLQKIQVGQTLFKFGQLFIKSQTFWIKNDLQTNIMVQLKIDDDEFDQSYLLPQIIPPGQPAGFDIVFMSSVTKAFKGFLKYVINDKYEFLIQVEAMVQEVRLSFNKTSIKCLFTEDNLEMETTENLKVTNNGNGNAYYEWIQQSEDKLFSITPVEGYVSANSFTEFIIKYSPNQNSSGKIDEEKLMLKVKDGVDMLLKVTGQVNEFKAELTTQLLNLGLISVYKKIEQTIWIQNYQKVSIIHVKDLPPFTQVTPIKAKLLPDECKPFKVSFFCKEEVDIDSELIFMPRGSKPIKMSYKVQTKIPDVYIKENNFDFGKLTTLGNPGFLTMNLINPSSMMCVLILDLRESIQIQGPECLEIEFEPQSIHKQQNAIELIDPSELEIKEPVDQQINMDQSQEQQSESELEVQAQEQEQRFYKITIQGNSELKFKLSFVAKEITAYHFQFPLTIFGVGYTKAITRDVCVIGLKPRFILEPQFIEFKKKIITSMDKRIPVCHKMILCNPDNQKLKYFIDTSKFDEDQIFNIQPNQGIIDEGQQIELSASFNPYRADFFEQSADLYIDDNLSDSQISIRLKGEGIFPRITFDRREVILPAVPCGITSKCVYLLLLYDLFYKFQRLKVYKLNFNYENFLNQKKQEILMSYRFLNFLIQTIFIIKVQFVNFQSLKFVKQVIKQQQKVFKVYNEGYENYNLKENIYKDLGPINLNINYIEGKNLSVTTSRLRIELNFKSNTPQSFTTKIDFTDETGRIYTIPVSGTSDNSIFTNYGYLQRCYGDYEIKVQDLQPIKIYDKMDESFNNEERRGPMSAQQSNFSANNNKSVLGYQLIPMKAMNQTCKGIMNWLNQFCLSQQIQYFPLDFINSNGSQMYEIITYFIGPGQKFNKKFDIATSGPDDQSTIYLQLVQQYEELILFLKEQGAQLNSIRPYYMLNYQDFCNFQKNDHMKDNIYANSLKISEQQFNYISNDNWIQLVFQVIKIYQLSKINLKLLKTNSILNQDQELFPDYYHETSNLFSLQEVILIRWLELHGLKNKDIRIYNLETDLRDGLVIAQLIKTFVKSESINKMLQLTEICSGEEEMKQNCVKVMNTIQELGLQVHIQVDDLVYPSQRDMLLFVSQLYFTLPHYQPKNQVIKFECILGDSVTKLIELNNSTQKGISYYVKYEGSDDFIIEESNFKIEPKSVYKFKIKFQSRISESQKMRIWFTNRKDGVSQAAALVFNLVSNITERRSIQSWDVTAKLYQQVEIKLQITNIFTKSNSESSIFWVDLVQVPKKKTKKNTEQQQTVFFMQKNQIQIKRGETAEFFVNFIPIEKDNYQCKLIFCDTRVGEFQHEINGVTDYPEISQEIRPQNIISVGQKVQQEIIVNLKNEFKLAALKMIDLKNNIKHKEYHQQDVVFQVTMEPPISFITIPDVLEIKNDAEIKDNFVKLPLIMKFNKPIINLEIKIILESLDKKDLRVYQLFLDIHPKPTLAKIEMVASLGDTIIQEIPLINYSDQDWVIKCQITNLDSKKNFFQGPKELKVKKQTTGYYQLSYNPNIIQVSNAQLMIKNPFTNDVFEYQLHGLVTEPLAQEHIVVKCNVRKLSQKQILIKNSTNKIVNYQVETDLVSAWGEAQFEIAPNQTYNYTLNINPLFGGIYTGSITFQDKDDPNKYIWYTICANVERPNYAQQLEIKCVIRKAAAFEIQLSNPLKEAITYEIYFDGEGLIGDQYIKLSPLKTASYEVIFSPTKIGTFKGQVSIINEKLGEIWYDLKLIGEPSVVQKLPLFKAELGKFCTKEIQLENNSDKQVEVNSVISNSLNFSVLPEKVQIQPYNSTTVLIKYIPTNIDVIEGADILIQSETIGDWKYEVQGVGLIPQQQETTKITSQMGSSTQFEIKFKNPFNFPISINLELIDGEQFKLLLKKKQLQINPLDDIKIQIEFSPQDMNVQNSKLIINNEKIQWTYPIIGSVDSLNNDLNFSFKTKTRVMYKTQIKLQLPSQQVDKVATYQMSIDKIQDFENVIERAIQITDVKNQIRNINDHLIFNVKFNPLKPLKTTAQLLIKKSTGPAWRFNLNLEATEPDVDDTIYIYSPLNITSTLSFKIHNKFNNESHFEAFFTSDSDPEFSISPKEGFLQSNLHDPQNFYISFTPIEYGTEKLGKIIIETQDLFWSFNVIGTFPQYVPPQIERSVLDNWNIKNLHKQQLKMNFLTGNINALKNKQNISKSKIKDRSFSYQQ